MIKESTEWRKHVEANSSLMKRFDESRVELEKVLKMAQSCLTERGNPEELLKKHTVRTRDLCRAFSQHHYLTILLCARMLKVLHTDSRHRPVSAYLLSFQFKYHCWSQQGTDATCNTRLKRISTMHKYCTKCGVWWELNVLLQEFFGQLDQRVLNTFLKACDELTDILPEQEQQSLQETVRKLHKHWKVGAVILSSWRSLTLFNSAQSTKTLLEANCRIFLESDSKVVVFLISQDIQSDAPFHLLHLKVEVERSKLMSSLQECQAEVTRENRHLASMGSERLTTEHRVSTEGLAGWLHFMYWST